MLFQSTPTAFKRQAVWLLIGAHSLMALNAQAHSYKPAPEAAMRPNFSAPSADNCARDIRTKEVAGQVVQAPNNAGWASAAPTSGRKAADARRDASESFASESLASDRPSKRDGKPKTTGEPVAPAASAVLTAPTTAPAPIAEREDMASPLAANSAAKMASRSHPSQPTQAISQSVVQRNIQNNIQTKVQTVTAGVVDDNANFGDYISFRARTQVTHRSRDIAERYLLQVKDAAGRGVADAEVWVQAPSGAAMWARTDAGGQVWMSPNAFDTARASTYQVNVRKPGRWTMAESTGFLQRGQKSAVEVTLDIASIAPQQRAKLDLVFLIDATGSMQDEIDKLKATLHTIVGEVSRLPSRPDLCIGLVAYRDKQDAFLIRSHDFTHNLDAFQAVLNKLQAGGGGDYPEAMNEALNEAVHNLSWRGSGTSRMVFLIADAPPHLDYSGPQYDDDMMAALGKGIKIFSVGASGLDKQGEYIQRQIAQYTGGKFVFLTYDKATNPASGPGRETVHDVQNYGVDTLDRLITRLVREELSKLGKTS